MKVCVGPKCCLSRNCSGRITGSNRSNCYIHIGNHIFGLCEPGAHVKDATTLADIESTLEEAINYHQTVDVRTKTGKKCSFRGCSEISIPFFKITNPKVPEVLLHFHSLLCLIAYLRNLSTSTWSRVNKRDFADRPSKKARNIVTKKSQLLQSNDDENEE